MLRLIAYDVAHPKRLRRVATICQNYGIRIEYSVFECDLDDTLFELFWEQLRQAVDEAEDRLIVYRICANCEEHIRTIGPVQRLGRTLLYIM